jgi:hypothetical protein
MVRTGSVRSGAFHQIPPDAVSECFHGADIMVSGIPVIPCPASMEQSPFCMCFDVGPHLCSKLEQSRRSFPVVGRRRDPIGRGFLLERKRDHLPVFIFPDIMAPG